MLNPKAVEDLLLRGADPTCLKHALNELSLNSNFGPRVEIMRLLIDYGADVHEKNGDDVTPLMEAVRGGSGEAVRLLLDAGAEIDAVDSSHGWTPLMRSANYRHLQGLRLLLERGAAVNVRDNEGRTALDIAQSQGEKEMVWLLKEAGAVEGEVLAATEAATKTKHDFAVNRQQSLKSRTLKPVIIRGMQP